MKDLGFISLLSLGLGGVAIDEDADLGTASASNPGVDPKGVLAAGWSVKRQVLGCTVVNDADETVGLVEDLLVSTTAAVVFAIVDVGVFVGTAGRRVAIPVISIKPNANGSFLLPGATTAKIASFSPFVEPTPASFSARHRNRNPLATGDFPE